MKGKRFEVGSQIGLLLLALSACGKAVDLDHQGHVTPSSDPSVLGTLDEWVVHLAVDDGRIYWSTDGGAVRGCAFSDCAGSVTTYAEQHAVASAGLAVQRGELFFASSSANAPGLVAMNVDRPDEQRLVLGDANPTALAVDEQGACLMGELAALSCISFVEPSATPVTLDPMSSLRPLLAMQGDYVYWLGTNPDDALLRARRDGSGTVDVLSQAISLDTTIRNQTYTYPTDQPEYGLAVDDGYIYFSQNVLAGSLARCPLAGCGTSPELVLDAVRSPMGLRRYGSRLYFLHEPDAYQYSLSSCTASDCEPTIVTSGLAGKRAIAVIDDFVYAAVTRVSLEPEHLRPAARTQLRRFAQ